MQTEIQKQRSKDYYEKNVQTILEKREAYRTENRDQINRKKRKAYRDNIITAKERSKQYRKVNREGINAYNRSYRQANPEKVREMEQRSREKKKGQNFNSIER